MGAALWSWFLVGSEGNVRHWSLLAGRRFRLSVPWCFAVSQPPARTLLWSCFEGMGAALWSWFLVGSESNIRHQLQQHHQQQQQEQQQQQAQQLQSLCFYQNPEGTSSPGTACFWRSFRPSGPWCFAVSQPPARTLLWSCFEGMGAALWSWFLVGSEGNVIGTSSSSTSAAAAAAAAAAGSAAKLALFLPESSRDVKPRDSMFLEVVPSFRAVVFCCFATAR